MSDSEAPRKEDDKQKRDRLGKFVGTEKDFRIIEKKDPAPKK